MQFNKRSDFTFIEQDEWNEMAAQPNSGLQPDYPSEHCDPKEGHQVNSENAPRKRYGNWRF